MGFVTKLLRLLESPSTATTATSATTAASWSITASVCYYTRLYGAQLLVVSVLSTMAVYRREMSCNRVYTSSTVVASPESKTNRRRRGSESGNSVIADEDWEESAEELLEGAGAYCSGEPLYAVVLQLWAIIFLESLTDNQKNLSSSLSSVYVNGHCSHPSHQATESSSSSLSDFITGHLPADVQVHLLSYLHPKDVVAFACCSRSSLAFVDQGETSKALWTTLWNRDYAWTVQCWKPGMEAYSRSQQQQGTKEALVDSIDKDFYFLFGLSHLNYILAGQNTFQQCYVGLYGHVYDITTFLHTHPGSPETLLIQSGKDATSFFQDMNHSSGARRLAQSLCVVVNNNAVVVQAAASSSQVPQEGATSRRPSCGLCPTPLTAMTITDESSLVVRPQTVEAPTVPMTRINKEPQRQAHGAATLQRISSLYAKQEAQMAKHAQASYASDPNVLSHVNVYFDPFLREWKGWYTSTQFEAVFVDGLQ